MAIDLQSSVGMISSVQLSCEGMAASIAAGPGALPETAGAPAPARAKPKGMVRAMAVATVQVQYKLTMPGNNHGMESKRLLNTPK